MWYWEAPSGLNDVSIWPNDGTGYRMLDGIGLLVGGKTYIEDDAKVYMKEENKIDIDIDLNLGKKNFTAYTMDLTKKYIEINADYRS